MHCAIVNSKQRVQTKQAYLHKYKDTAFVGSQHNANSEHWDWCFMSHDDSDNDHMVMDRLI